MRDRLYRSKASPDCLAAMGGVPPEFPYIFNDIQQSRGPTIDRAKQEAERKAAEAAQQAYAAQQQQAYEAAQLQQQQQVTLPASSTYGQAPVPAADTSNALPPEWIEIQDPASGYYYYANQTTGEVTWDRPQAAPAAQPAPVRAATPQPDPQQPMNVTSPNGKRATSTLASKYGDGFVTSSSHPALASQYGNVGTRYDCENKIYVCSTFEIISTHAFSVVYLAFQQSLRDPYTTRNGASCGACQGSCISQFGPKQYSRSESRISADQGMFARCS